MPFAAASPTAVDSSRIVLRPTASRKALAHELFERWAAASPDSVALRFQDEALSYRELNRRANRLAHALGARGIGAGCRVVVCVEPSLGSVVALLGILKAGAIYVPLDPAYPAARVRAILDDTCPALVLTEKSTQARLELASDALLLDALPDTWGELPADNPALAIEPEQSAYVYYTSGTTGTPKGVVGSHANLAHYVESARSHFGFDEHDVMPALARTSFSISMFELMTPLASGGTLVVLERSHVLDPERLARTLADVTIFHAGPTLLKALVAHLRRHGAEFSAFPRVRHASSGGDLVPPDLLEAMKEIFASAEIFVIYGCSEISCMGCTHLVPRDHRVTKTYVGRPFQDVTVEVLDTTGTPVPAGVVGEIYFAGEGLTHGYLNRPELTAERFVSHHGRRFYRTGDLGRLARDGLLEVLGRSDFQVKIRGMRVELGDVEHHLRSAPGVRDAVVAAKPGSDGENLLVAYFVAEPAEVAGVEKPERIHTLRRRLRAELPDYMVPAVYVELDALPVNHNLKLDRRALPDPREEDYAALRVTHRREPRTPTERVLAGLFTELLVGENIGLDDNFFELGGHSLLAEQLCSNAERAFGVQLEGIEVLREPLEILARLVDRRRGLPDSPPPASAPRVVGPNEVETFHFGPHHQLYGVLHGPRPQAERAVLICGALGQEHVRSRFVLARLTRELTRQRVPVLYFDYFGVGDSQGESGDALAGRWRADILDAHAELRRRTSATRVVAVGVRLGGLLLSAVASELELERLVLWDPVADGAEHLADLRALQRQYQRSVAHLSFWQLARARPAAGDLLGTTYSDSVQGELASLKLPPLLAAQRAPTRWLATSQPGHERSLAHGLGAPRDCRVLCSELDCGWHDLSQLEDVIPDVELSRTLEALVTEPS